MLNVFCVILKHAPFSVNSSNVLHVLFSDLVSIEQSSLQIPDKRTWKWWSRHYETNSDLVCKYRHLIQSHIFMRTFTHLGWGIFWIYSMYSLWAGWAIDFRRLLVMKTILRPEGDVLCLVAWKLLFLPRGANLVAIMPWHALCNTMQSCYVNQQRCFCSDHISINIVLMWSQLN